MEFAKLIEKARSVRKEYTLLEQQGIRDTEDVDQKLAHELSDCLWSIIVLADYYGVDLEASSIKTMDQLQTKIGNQK